MDKFMHFVEDKMSPIADKLGEQRHLSAMQKGFMTVLPLIFVGAVFMVIANPPVTADMVKSGGIWSIFSGWLNFATKYKMTILVPYNMSMGLLAMAVAFVIADNLATSYSMKGITSGLTALVVFLLVAAPANYLALADGTTSLLMNCTYLGAQGLFTAIIVALLTVEITRFCEIHNITIRLPEICPPALTNSFRTIVPSIFRISEPALFGAPIMFNPVLMIPFIANGLIVAILYWLACSFGLVTAPYLLISGTYPIFLSIFVYCLDWRVLVFVALMIPLTLAIWYPFFVAYDHSLCKKEEATKLAEEEA